MAKKYEYFISYLGLENNNDIRIGRCVFSDTQKINSLNAITKIENQIKEDALLKNVTILNFQLLGVKKCN